MKHILVPTDFSKQADNAVNFAIQTARLFSSEITLLHVFEMSGNMYTDYIGINKEFTDTVRNDVIQKLEQMKEDIAQREGIVVKWLVYQGGVNAEIRNASEENDIDLIIMGTHGARGIRENLWGSQTWGVIRQSRIPVMVIPVEYSWKKPEKLLMATNHFEKKPAILDPLFQLSKIFGAKIQVAVFTETEEEPEFYPEHNRQIIEYEKELVEEYKDENLSTIHLYGEDFEQTLQNHISKAGVDILAMITYHRSFLDRMLHPSQTRQMAFHTSIPLLAIPVRE
ncbi:MAG TPA: hypothetical protein DIW47_08685 [Bacteroidetes bacterium]|nr:hypothetical protein [Bacteroidota bacterium]